MLRFIFQNQLVPAQDHPALGDQVLDEQRADQRRLQLVDRNLQEDDDAGVDFKSSQFLFH